MGGYMLAGFEAVFGAAIGAFGLAGTRHV